MASSGGVVAIAVRCCWFAVYAHHPLSWRLWAKSRAVLQYRQVLRTLKPSEIPTGYLINLSVLTNLIVAALGTALTAYLFRGTLL